MRTHSILAAAIFAGATLITTSFTTAATVVGGQKILIIPFSTLNLPPNQQWVAKAVQENIIADFGHNTSLSPIAFQTQTVVEDNLTAARMGKEASAPLVIRGAAQEVDQTIRLTAQLIDSATGDTITTAMATGPANDLLKLEDSLSQQLRGAIAPTADATPQAQPDDHTGVAAAPASTTVAPANPSVQIIYVPTPQQQSQPIYTSPYYTQPYDYSDAGYYPPYYGYGGGVVFITSGFGRGGFNRGGFGSGGFRGGFGGGFGGGVGRGIGGGFNHSFSSTPTFTSHPSFSGGARGFGGGFSGGSRGMSGGGFGGGRR